MLMSAVGAGILQSVYVPVGLQPMHESWPYISCRNTRYVPRYLEVTSPVDGTPGRSSSLFGRSLCLLLPRFQTGVPAYNMSQSHYFVLGFPLLSALPTSWTI